MAEVEISVRGQARRGIMPECARVRASVGSLSAEPGESYDLVVTSTGRVEDAAKRRYDAEAGPVTEISVERIQTWLDRDSDHHRLPPAYHASVRMDVTYSDFRELSTWQAECAEIDGFAVDWVVWDLTDEHRRWVQAELETEAVQEALRKAQQCADALSLGAVQVRTVADQGKLRDAHGTYTAREPGEPMPAIGSAAADHELKPKEIDLYVDVEARFVAEEAAR